MSGVWKSIKGYEGLYMVSNLGEVKSVERIETCKNGHVRKRREKILIPFTSEKGYSIVSLSKNGKVKKELVHRLVANAFIPNPLKKPEVNHILEDRKDLNSIWNLEWVSSKENANYGTRNIRISRKLILNAKEDLRNNKEDI